VTAADPREERPYRTGRKLGRTIYQQHGPDPSDEDTLIGVMDTPELGALVVAALNGAPERDQLRATKLVTDEQLRKQAELIAELRARAERYAGALVMFAHDDGAAYTDDCSPDKYVACEAARWLAEREASDG